MNSIIKSLNLNMLLKLQGRCLSEKLVLLMSYLWLFNMVVDAGGAAGAGNADVVQPPPKRPKL